MNWKKRKIITAITAIATIGTLYATVGPRHHRYFNQGCHAHQTENCQEHSDKVDTPKQNQNRVEEQE